MTETTADETRAPRKPSVAQRIAVFAITALCFAYLYYRLNGAAMREGLTLLDYMSEVFANVAWIPWLFLMMAYSCVYLAIDTLVVTRALKWFVKDIPYRDVLPLRARTAPKPSARPALGAVNRADSTQSPPLFRYT